MMYKSILALCLFFAITAPTHYANAQLNSATSTAEDIALFFYKTGNATPNFRLWAKESDDYAKQPVARREGYIVDHMIELSSKYQNIDIKEDLITIKMPVNLFIEMNKDEPITNEVNELGEALTARLAIRFNGAENLDYFPYIFLDQKIAVIPNNLKEFQNVNISERDFELIKQANQFNHRRYYDGVFELKARTVDLTQPHNLDGANQWIFRTDIAVLSVLNKRGNVVWQMSAPWYTAPNEENLHELYQGQRPEIPIDLLPESVPQSVTP